MKPRDHRSSRAHWPDLYIEFRLALIRAREEVGLTQRDVAKRLGRSQSFVAKSETGERREDVIELASFASVYGRPLSYFIPVRLHKSVRL